MFFGKINIKKSILEIVEKNNLEILKIDLYNDEESFARSYNRERDEYCKTDTTLKDLDFEVEPIFVYDKVRGVVYCQDKDTKEPVWIVSRGDEGGSWWEVNRVPEFYKNQSKTKRMEHSYEIKTVYVGYRVYKIGNGFSIHVNITVKEINIV